MNHNTYPKKEKKEAAIINKGKKLPEYLPIISQIEEEKPEHEIINNEIVEHEPEMKVEKNIILESSGSVCSSSDFPDPPLILTIIGETGPQGLEGIKGQDGPPGQKGQVGLEGPPGEDGCSGRRGPTGSTGPTGPYGIRGSQGVTGPMGVMGGGPGVYACELRNPNDMLTSINTCNDGIIRETADQLFLLTDSTVANPFDPSNTTGVNMEYFDIQNGIYRAGFFRASDLISMGEQSAAFGHWTRAEGKGSLAFGYNLSDDTLNAGADSSVVFGKTDNGTIKTLPPATASLAFGDVSGGGIIQITDGSGTIVMGVATDGGVIQSQATASTISGIAMGNGSMITANNAISADIAGIVTNGGVIIADDGTIGASINGVVQDQNSLMKIGTNSVGGKIRGEVVDGAQMIIGSGSVSSNIKGIVEGSGSFMTTGNNTIASNLSGKVMNDAQMITGNNTVGSEIGGIATEPGSILKIGSSTIGGTVKGMATNAGQIIVDKNSFSSSAIGTADGENSMIFSTTKTVASTVGGVAKDGGQIIVDAGAITASVHGMAEGYGSMLMAEYFTTGSNVRGQVTNGSQITIDKNSVSSDVSGCADDHSMIFAGQNTVGIEITGMTMENGMMMIDKEAIATNINGMATKSSTMMLGNNTVGSSINGHTNDGGKMMIDANSISSNIEGSVMETGSLMMTSNNTIGSSIAGGVTGSGSMLIDTENMGTEIKGYSNNTGSIIMSGRKTVAGNINSKTTNGGMAVINDNTVGSHISGHAEMNGLLSISPNAIGSAVKGFVSNGMTGPFADISRNKPFETRFTSRNCKVAAIQAGGCGNLSNGCAIGESSLIIVEDDVSGSNASGMAYFGGQIKVEDGAHGAIASGGVSGSTGNYPSTIIVDTNADGGQAYGYAEDGGIIRVGKNSHGSIITGLAYKGEQHEISGNNTSGEGSANFGRNNLVNTNYALVVGCGTVSNTFCSVNQSGGENTTFANNIRNVVSADAYNTNFVLGTGLIPTLNSPSFVNGELNVVGTRGNYIAQKFTANLDQITLLYTTNITTTLFSSGITIGTGAPTPNGIELYVIPNPLDPAPEKFCAKIEMINGAAQGPTGPTGSRGPTGPTGPTGTLGPYGYKQWNIQSVAQLNWYSQPFDLYIEYENLFGYPTKSAFDGEYLWVPENGEVLIKIHAASGEIASIIPSYWGNAWWTNSVTFDGTRLWLTSYIGSVGQVTGINLDGSLYTTITGSMQRPYDSVYDGTYVWVTDISRNSVFRFDAVTGANLVEFGAGGSAPYSMDSPEYITSDGTNIWVSCYNNNRVIRMSQNGVYLQTILGFNSPQDLCFDGTHVWVCDYNNDLVKGYDLNGNFFTSVSVINPYAITCVGLNIWVTSPNAGMSGNDTAVVIFRASDGTVLRLLDSESFFHDQYGPSPEYITFDGTYVWISDSFSLNRILV